MTEQTSKYRCSHCGKLCTRESTKKWIRSYCTTAKAYVRMWNIDYLKYAPKKLKDSQ